MHFVDFEQSSPKPSRVISMSLQIWVTDPRAFALRLAHIIKTNAVMFPNDDTELLLRFRSQHGSVEPRQRFLTTVTAPWITQRPSASMIRVSGSSWIRISL